MWFLAKDRRIPISDLVLTDDLSTYHNMITFKSSAKLYTSEGKIETNTSQFDVCVVNQTRIDENTMKVDCVTKAVEKAFNSITAGYTGYTTLNNLFSKLGFNYKSDYKSNNTYFCVRQYSVITLFNELTKYASFSNGGGAHFFMTYKGEVRGFDYKLIKEKAAVGVLSGSILSETIKTDWREYTPSEYELFIYDNNNKFTKETLTLVSGYGKAAVRITDTTGVFKDATKQELTNVFYNKWYNGHTVNVSVPMGVIPEIGTLVNLNNTGKTFIVKSVTVGYNESQKIPSVSATLISNPTI